ncbi:MAG: twin-arginine translocase subunit TatC [Acidaminococcaceae bacterium]
MPEKQLANNNSDAFDEIVPYQKPLKEHIRELRKRLLYCVITVAVSFFIIVTFFADGLMQLLASPIRERGIEFIYLGLAEALTAQLRVSFIVALAVSSPLVFWHIWDFVKPALYDSEKKAVLGFTFGSIILFLAGIAFGYGVVFLSAITFFVYTGENVATPMLSISQYVSFLFGFVLSFGLVFEMPIVTYVLCKTGIVTVAQLVAIRKYIVLVIFIVAAFLTPPDALSQILMALPMLVLYEIGIVVARLTCGKNEVEVKE